VTQDLGTPELAFSRQTVSFWLNGTRRPKFEHRKILATILGVSWQELARETNGEERVLEEVAGIKVRVYGTDAKMFDYSLTLMEGVDLKRAAIFDHWAGMFSSRPAPLMRHFRGFKYKLFGWIPDNSGFPIVLRSPCLVPLRTDHLTVENSIANQRRVWFINLPDGTLDVGIAYKDRNSLFLLKYDEKRIKQYPLSRIDLIGSAIGRVLFQIDTPVDKV
jgi:transcriptional regulator with XRE-family HTH domain